MCTGGKSSTGPLECCRELHLPSSCSQQEAINKPLLPLVATNITAPSDTRWLLAEGGREAGSLSGCGNRWMPCHELGWKGSCALSLVTNLGTWAYTAVWERLLKAHDHLIITLRLLISPGWIPKSCVDIWPQQAPGGITTKETGVDGVSTQVGSTRASISSHSTVQLQAQPCGLVTAPWSQIAKADHINRLQRTDYRADLRCLLMTRFIFAWFA